MAGTGSSGACRCLSQGNFGFEILDHPLQRAALVVRRDAVVLCQEIGQRLLPGAPLLQRSFDEIVHLAQGRIAQDNGCAYASGGVSFIELIT